MWVSSHSACNEGKEFSILKERSLPRNCRGTVRREGMTQKRERKRSLPDFKKQRGVKPAAYAGASGRRLRHRKDGVPSYEIRTGWDTFLERKLVGVNMVGGDFPQGGRRGCFDDI